MKRNSFILLILYVMCTCTTRLKSNGYNRHVHEIFVSDRISVDSKLLKTSLNILKDSLYNTFNCDILEAIDLEIKISEDDTSLILNPLFIEEWKIYPALKSHRDNKYYDHFYLFLLDEVWVKIGKTEFNQSRINFKLVQEQYELNVNEFKPSKTDRCKNRKNVDFNGKIVLTLKIKSGKPEPTEFKVYNL